MIFVFITIQPDGSLSYNNLPVVVKVNVRRNVGLQMKFDQNKFGEKTVHPIRRPIDNTLYSIHVPLRMRWFESYSQFPHGQARTRDFTHAIKSLYVFLHDFFHCKTHNKLQIQLRSDFSLNSDVQKAKSARKAESGLGT